MPATHELTEAGFAWEITPTRRPSKLLKGRSAPGWLARIYDAKDPQRLDVSYIVLQARNYPLDEVLRQCILKNSAHQLLAPIAAVLQDERGVTPAEIDPERISEGNIGESLTVALRKALDGTASAVLWQAAQLLPEGFYAIALERAREHLNGFIERGVPYSRRQLGLSLQSAWEEAADEMYDKTWSEQYKDAGPTKRDRMRFMVLSFRLGVESLSTEDWIFGMTSLIIKEAAS